MTENLCILGSTGSIGRQAVETARHLGIRVCAISGGRNEDLVCEQALMLKPDIVAMADENAGKSVKTRLASENCRVVWGKEAIESLAAESKCDTVLDSIVGIAGLRPLLAAIPLGIKVALANKESLVTGGEIVTALAKKENCRILPVDSEHSAIFQCLQGSAGNSVKSILLTASGGPFYGKTREELKNVTAEDALRHPTWNMGAKITVDSATLMNKGFEVMEAMWLYGLRLDQVRVTIHRQSIVHSMVEFEDGSVIAQLGNPDMRLPIQYALTYPERVPSLVKRLEISDMRELTFGEPDTDTFRCLALCMQAASEGGLMPTVVNGANEEAVKLFLDGRIKFLDIADIVGAALERPGMHGVPVTLESIENADREARRTALDYFDRKIKA